MKKQIEIKVMGQKFVVRSDSSEDYVNQVATFVDQKMNEVVKNSKSVASLNVAILAAMNIADEYLKYRMNKERQHTQVEKKIKDVIELIDLQS
ncbi:MAG: cell division protein ZapA [Deltaproteobacteria bacterium]|nr:cell division protein ZapA [Deltaproteobacteria bacterium]